MGDSLEENFVLEHEDEEEEAPTTTKPLKSGARAADVTAEEPAKKQRKRRKGKKQEGPPARPAARSEQAQALTAAMMEAGKLSQLEVKEIQVPESSFVALNNTEPRSFDGLLDHVIPTECATVESLLALRGDKKSKLRMVVFCMSAERCFEVSVAAQSWPGGVVRAYAAGGGNKKDQIRKQADSIRDTKKKGHVVVATPGRALRLLAEGHLALSDYDLLVLDNQPNIKTFTVLTMRESRSELLRFFREFGKAAADDGLRFMLF
mmetsp:Transcript_67803/g.180560  ORF Transcript_67803/g.180560 Transcript_67803/m.180560 type:complete len:263 (-) Transcript_67803:170-958(-)